MFLFRNLRWGDFLYEYIKGIYTYFDKDYIVIENGNIGYKINTSGNTLKNLPEKHENIMLFTTLLVREDFMGLYGFLTRDELKLFNTLLSINGVGAKASLSLLSVSSPDNLKNAIFNEDINTLTKAPGIGPKTAKRIILELKDKITITQGLEDKDNGENEIILVLTALGYNEKEAKNAVSKIDKNLPLEASIKNCLKLLMR